MTATLYTDAQLATMSGPAPYGLIAGGAVLLEAGRIVWVGATADAPTLPKGASRVDLGGRLMTPGLIDCHTHIIHGGHRAGEFEQRLKGASYAEIAASGGGIVSTVAATRAASEDDLLASALPRLDAMLAEGVTTLEVKSGYGLTVADEVKMLRAARRLATVREVRVVTSYLGAHAVPPEYRGRTDAYIDEVCLPALDAAHAAGLVDAVDGFCEGIAFSAAQMARVFDRARALGLPVKLHAEQLSHQGGAALVAARGGLSADHLEYATKADAMAMAAAGTVAVILPGAFYTLRERQAPPIEAFRRAGVAMAVASDMNPGSSPMASPTLAMNMACTFFGLTPEEALRGTTEHAARALGLRDCGRIAPGLRADLAIWEAAHPAELAYRIGCTPLHSRLFAGAT